MAALLTINTGSTSVKLALFALEAGGAPAERAREHHDGGELDPREILTTLAAKLAEPPEMIVHRIVHGGTRFSTPTLIDSEILAAIEALTPLAPLHNPTAVRWVRAALEVWGQRYAPAGRVRHRLFCAAAPGGRRICTAGRRGRGTRSAPLRIPWTRP